MALDDILRAKNRKIRIEIEEHLEKIKRETEKNPDANPSYLIIRQNLHEGGNVKELIKLKSEEKSVQKVYAHLFDSFLSNYSSTRRIDLIDKIRKLEEATNIKLAENIIQEAYAVCVKSDWFLCLDELQKATGIKPLEEIIQWRYAEEKIIQKRYKDIFKSGDFSYLNELRELTGIIPVLSEAAVQKEYAASIKDPYFLDDLTSLQEATGIKISEELIKKEYVLCVQQEEYGKLGALQKLTGILFPEAIITAVQEKYVALARGRDYRSVVIIKEETRIELPILSDYDSRQINSESFQLFSEREHRKDMEAKWWLTVEGHENDPYSWIPRKRMGG